MKSLSSHSSFKVVNLPIADLSPYKNNPRTHSSKQIQKIAESIKAFGFTNPVLLDQRKGVIAGHGRIEAAKLLGMKIVPTIELAHMTKAQKCAYIIADNKLAEDAGWDQELLAEELKYISELDMEFDLTLTGFETAEIDIILENYGDPVSEDMPLVHKGPVISKLGDLWLLGAHRLLCADALDPQSYKTILGEEKAQLIFTDPPYNVPISGHVSGKGRVKHDEFQMASGEMSASQFTAFLEAIFKNLSGASEEGSLHYICMDWRHLREILDASDCYGKPINLCIWNKTNGGMGSHYRSKHELVFVFKKGKGAHINNIDLGRHGRYRTNVWDYAGVNTFHESRDKELAMHPTVKPVAMIKDAILDSSKRGNIILDCFGGSGSTLIAAEGIGRKARLIELDPRYVDTIIERFEKECGLQAVHADTKLTYQQIKMIRNSNDG